MALGGHQQPKVVPRQARWMMWGELLIAPMVPSVQGGHQWTWTQSCLADVLDSTAAQRWAESRTSWCSYPEPSILHTQKGAGG